MAELLGAVKAGNVEEVQKYITEEQDVNYKDRSGFTPLHEASHRGHKTIVEILVANAANVNAKSNSSKTPLHLASEESQKKVVEVLLKYNPDINSKDDSRYTPLMYATQKRGKEVTILLLKAGTDRDLQNKNGKTAVMIAKQLGYDDIVELFNSFEKRDTDETGNDDGIEEDFLHTVVMSDEGKCTFENYGTEYEVQGKNINVYLPVLCAHESRQNITLTLKDPHTTSGLREITNQQFASDVIFLEPHGKSFSEHLVIKLPITKKFNGVQDAKLLYNSSGDPENPKWVILPTNRGSFQKSRYFFADESHFYIFTNHLSGYCLADCPALAEHHMKVTPNLPEATEISVALYGSYSETRQHMACTVAFTCACHPHNYNQLLSEKLIQKYGQLIIEPFPILILRKDVQAPEPVFAKVSLSTGSVSWSCLASENKQPCLQLGFKCDETVPLEGISTLKSKFRPPRNGTKDALVELTVSQLEDWRKENIIYISDHINTDDTSHSQEKKRHCLCTNKVCSQKRGNCVIRYSTRQPFSNVYLNSEYQIFYDILNAGEYIDKYRDLLSECYGVKFEKNNLPRGREAVSFFRRAPSSTKKRGFPNCWVRLWHHIKESDWSKAKEALEFVYERDKLLKWCDVIKQKIRFYNIRPELETKGLLSMEQSTSLSYRSFTDEENLDFIMKHILLNEVSVDNYEDTKEEAIKSIKVFHSIIRKHNPNLSRLLTLLKI